jgi:hypothetical protein
MALSPLSHSIPPDRLYLPPPHFASPRPSLFFNAAFPRPRDGAAAFSCAAADYDPAREHEDYNNDDDDYAWGGEGHRRDHPGSYHRGNSPKHRRNRLKTLPSMGIPRWWTADDPLHHPQTAPLGGTTGTPGLLLTTS